jgi:hypothetical protein
VARIKATFRGTEGDEPEEDVQAAVALAGERQPAPLMQALPPVQAQSRKPCHDTSCSKSHPHKPPPQQRGSTQSHVAALPLAGPAAWRAVASD